MRVAWFSECLEGLSRSSALTAALVPVLRQSLDIEVFTSDGLYHPRAWSAARADSESIGEGIEEPPSILLFHYLRAFERHATVAPFDVFVLNFEDRPASSFMLAVQAQLSATDAGCCIGIFHDINLNTAYWQKLKHNTGAGPIEREMRELFGESVPAIGEWFERGWRFDVLDSTYCKGRREWARSAVPLTFHGSFLGLDAMNSGSSHRGVYLPCFPVPAVVNTLQSQTHPSAAETSPPSAGAGLPLGVFCTPAVASWWDGWRALRRSLEGLSGGIALESASLQPSVEDSAGRDSRVVFELVLIAESQEDLTTVMNSFSSEKLPQCLIRGVVVPDRFELEMLLQEIDIFVYLNWDPARGFPLAVWQAIALECFCLLGDVGYQEDVKSFAVHHGASHLLDGAVSAGGVLDRVLYLPAGMEALGMLDQSLRALTIAHNRLRRDQLGQQPREEAADDISRLAQKCAELVSLRRSRSTQPSLGTSLAQDGERAPEGAAVSGVNVLADQLVSLFEEKRAELAGLVAAEDRDFAERAKRIIEERISRFKLFDSPSAESKSAAELRADMGDIDKEIRRRKWSNLIELFGLPSWCLDMPKDLEEGRRPSFSRSSDG